MTQTSQREGHLCYKCQWMTKVSEHNPFGTGVIKKTQLRIPSYTGFFS